MCVAIRVVISKPFWRFAKLSKLSKQVRICFETENGITVVENLWRSRTSRQNKNVCGYFTVNCPQATETKGSQAVKCSKILLCTMITTAGQAIYQQIFEKHVLNGILKSFEISRFRFRNDDPSCNSYWWEIITIIYHEAMHLTLLTMRKQHDPWVLVELHPLNDQIKYIFL